VRLTAAAAVLVAVTGCSSGQAVSTDESSRTPATSPAAPPPEHMSNLLPGMPPPLRFDDIYAANRELSPAVAGHRELVYVPNSRSHDVSVIDPATFRVIDTFSAGGVEPQHVVPSYDLQTLYVTNDLPIGGGSLLPIDPRTGKPGTSFPV